MSHLSLASLIYTHSFLLAHCYRKVCVFCPISTVALVGWIVSTTIMTTNLVVLAYAAQCPVLILVLLLPPLLSLYLSLLFTLVPVRMLSLPSCPSLFPLFASEQCVHNVVLSHMYVHTQTFAAFPPSKPRSTRTTHLKTDNDDALPPPC